MTKTNVTTFVALGMAAVVLAGCCCDGMETTFVNELDETIEADAQLATALLVVKTKILQADGSVKFEKPEIKE